MHPSTPQLMKRVRTALFLRKKLSCLENAYAGETAYVLTCGPSINLFWNDTVRAFLRDKLVLSVKQTHDLAPEICDFHILNSWNYSEYRYAEPRPIVVSERGPRDPLTPGMRADLMFRVPRPNDFEERLATTWHFDEWLLSRRLERPWGPGVMYELCFPLLVHLGVKEIVTLGWDLGEKNAPGMPHFFHEEPAESGKSDGIVNKPRIRPYEVGDVARSTRGLYYWLRSKGIYLYVMSDRSLVDEVVPRISSLEVPRRREYETEVIGNGEFSAWSGGAPRWWAVEPSPAALRPTHDTPDGSTGIEFVSGSGSANSVVSQSIQLERFFGGAGFSGRIHACSSEAGACEVVIEISPRGHGEKIEFRSTHPGDGEWRRIVVEGAIPNGFDPQALTMSIRVRGGASKGVKATGAALVLRK